jgi:hypothetical protein
MSVKLCYSKCGSEVNLGDLIAYKPICRREIPGTVIYLPGISPAHPRFERQGFRQWAIQLENGWILAWLFAPSELQPSRRLRFVRRAMDGFKGLDPTAELL